MEFSPNIVEMLGQSRIGEIHQRLAAFRSYLSSMPRFASSALHSPIQLNATDQDGAVADLCNRLRESGPDWFFVTAVMPDGRRIGYASDRFRPQHRSATEDIVVQFVCYDIHSTLRSWWLSHIWRAADYVDATEQHLSDWTILPASACARALLEGVAAFVIEGEELLAEWSKFKQMGKPKLEAVGSFRDSFLKRLMQVQFGSRIGEKSGTPVSPVKRTNILTILEKFAKQVGPHLWKSYEWLCDAVHPSYGFGTVYVAVRGIHETRAIIGTDWARRTDIAQTLIPKIEPTVAWAAADVLTSSIDGFLRGASRIRWLIDDLGLTTGIALNALQPASGKTSWPTDESDCPCGSGLCFKSCSHVWGRASIPSDNAQ